jgi:hypothetical protein
MSILRGLAANRVNDDAGTRLRDTTKPSTVDRDTTIPTTTTNNISR